MTQLRSTPHRRLALAAAGVLLIGLVTACVAVFWAAGDVRAASADLNAAKVLQGTDRALVAVLKELGGGSTQDTNQAMADLAESSAKLDLDKLSATATTAEESAIALLEDPSGLLATARAAAGVAALPGPLRDSVGLVSDSLRDAALRSNAAPYVTATRFGSTGVQTDAGIDDLVDAAQSLANSARARLITGIIGGLIALGGIVFLVVWATRQDTPDGADRPKRAGVIGAVIGRVSALVPGRRPKAAGEPASPTSQPTSGLTAQPVFPPVGGQPQPPSAGLPASPPIAGGQIPPGAAQPPAAAFAATSGPGQQPAVAAQQPTGAFATDAFATAAAQQQPVGPVAPTTSAAQQPTGAGQPPAAVAAQQPAGAFAQPAGAGQPSAAAAAQQPAGAFAQTIDAAQASAAAAQLAAEIRRPAAGAQGASGQDPTQATNPFAGDGAGAAETASSEEGVPLVDVLQETLALLEHPRQVRWAINATAAIHPVQAPRLAHAVAELVDAAASKSGSLAVLVRVEVTEGRLEITVTDAAEGPGRGTLALGPKPSSVLTLVKTMGASLTASPNATGRGTDTRLSLPHGGGMD
ncbi:MAG: hypothetical protein LBE08_05810 [Bifidobacteriaceae bacterium]|jgi:hypothetical protein|nr:hypothetical protein [Bifidobacteriaceae bacterium]